MAPKPTYGLLIVGFLMIGAGLFQLAVNRAPLAYLVIIIGVALIASRIWVNRARKKAADQARLRNFDT